MIPSSARDVLRLVARFTDGAALDLRLVGKTLLHAAVVGVLAGLVGAAFFAGLEVSQRLLLEGVAGFPVLRARGEVFTAAGLDVATLDPLWLVVLPAMGGLASGVLTSWLAPEAAGGGGDATIDAYHRGRALRGRLIPVKGLASILALSTGGSGGREGPTMQIGAAIGAVAGRLMPASRAERRVLVVAGVAAGISAVFRTPLGAALLATEMLYRDDFEAEALVPSILASVVAYSVVIALFGETTLFGALPRIPFTPAHLALHALLALAIAVAAMAFVGSIRVVQRASRALRLPSWASPGIGGLLTGIVGTGVAMWMTSRHGPGSVGFGVFGGGYGVLQAAMSSPDWLGNGAGAVALLVAVALAKIAASALTIGSGASAGDFAPSLVIGGLVGAAFGHGAREVLGDPSIQPAAFALVGMGTLYGALAHVPLSALVLVAELAGSYDLLVPMMLSIAIAYVALRRHTLYPAQVASRFASPAHRANVRDDLVDSLRRRTANELLVPPEVAPVEERASVDAVLAASSGARLQRVVAVRGAAGLDGIVDLTALAEIPAAERHWIRARDAAVRFAAVEESATWAEVAEVLDRCGASQVPVVRGGEITGWIGDRELRRAVLER